MQALVGEGREVAEMAEGVFAEHLADYPGLELTWLQGMFEQRAVPAQAAPLLPSSGAASQAAAGLVGLLPAAIQSRFAQARCQCVGLRVWYLIPSRPDRPAACRHSEPLRAGAAPVCRSWGLVLGPWTQSVCCLPPSRAAWRRHAVKLLAPDNCCSGAISKSN